MRTSLLKEHSATVNAEVEKGVQTQKNVAGTEAAKLALVISIPELWRTERRCLTFIWGDDQNLGSQHIKLGQSHLGRPEIVVGRRAGRTCKSGRQRTRMRRPPALGVLTAEAFSGREAGWSFRRPFERLAAKVWDLFGC